MQDSGETVALSALCSVGLRSTACLACGWRPLLGLWARQEWRMGSWSAAQHCGCSLSITQPAAVSYRHTYFAAGLRAGPVPESGSASPSRHLTENFDHSAFNCVSEAASSTHSRSPRPAGSFSSAWW